MCRPKVKSTDFCILSQIKDKGLNNLGRLTNKNL